MKRGLATLAAVLLGLFLLRMALLPMLAGTDAPLPTKASWIKIAAKGGAIEEPQSMPLVPAATEADGSFECVITAEGQPLAGVNVRLYKSVDDAWFTAGQTRTDGEGRARFFAPVGHYFIAARHNGFAPLQREINRPAHEPITQVTWSLQRGVKIDGNAAPNTLVLLKEHVPVEERIEAKSDAQGVYSFSNVEPK